MYKNQDEKIKILKASELFDKIKKKIQYFNIKIEV